MSAVQRLLTDHIDIWTAADTQRKSGRGRASGNAGSVYGVKKLRDLILELAVRGKLVPQDVHDEAASVLIQRIDAERARFNPKTAGKGKLVEMGGARQFELPVGWVWSNLGLVSLKITDGEHISPKKTPDGMPLLSAKDVTETGVLLNSDQFVSASDGMKFRERCDPRKGDILICSRGTIGRCAIVDFDDLFCLMGSVILIKNSHEIYPNYVLRYLQSPLAQKWMLGASFATAVSALYLKDVAKCEVPIPPLAEQHRIVTKVDELMALCDQLEAQHSNAAEAHEKLVGQLLNTLTSSESAEYFIANWTRIAAHFDTLFTTETSIDQLKQTLLQLAVLGKLVPQDPSDEPISKLLADNHAKLVAARKMKKGMSFPHVTIEEMPFQICHGWEWRRFGEIGLIDANLVKPEDFMEFRQVAPDCIEKSTGRLTESRTVRESGIRGPNSRFFSGQIVYSKIRPSLSKAVLVDFDGLCSADMYPINSLIDPKFLLKLILSELFLEQVRSAENRIKMPKLNQESLNAFVLPIPPLREQQRIVAKIDELMALCDGLKSRLQDANQLQRKLADVLVEHAMA